MLGPHEARLNGLHGPFASLRIGPPEMTRPTLRQRIDLAFAVGVRAERRAVVEKGADDTTRRPRRSPRWPMQRPRRVRDTLRPGSFRRGDSATWRIHQEGASRNQPSQMLSPLPSAPTLLKPSFQSHVPINGKPWTRPRD